MSSTQSDDSSFTLFNKFNDEPDLLGHRNFCFDFLERLGDVQAGMIDQLVNMLKVFDSCFAEISALQTNGVQAVECQRFGSGENIWRNVFCHPESAADH